ncbi:MAG: NAD-dependent epimerase/dehydratase family protein [Ignavibacteriales bacterium]|nr:NAD-dependent epimerase/dehydratase family protein [Ignavibacteriales bacterium]
MPTRIAVTGANGQVGRAVLERLQDFSVETIALTREPGNLPARRTLVCGLDSDRAFKAMHEADAVIHLAGTLNPRSSNTYYAANVATTVALADAARDSNIKRVVFLSYVGADECSSNEYLRTKAQAEQLLWSTGISTVVFRCTHIVGPPDTPGPTAHALLSHDGETISILGSGRQMVAPIFLGDVVSAILMAVDKGRGGLYELAGPERMNTDDLVRLLNRNERVAVRHLPERLARFLSIMHPGLPSPLVEVMVKPSVGDPSAAVKEFGIKLTSLRSVWKSDFKSDSRGEFTSAGREQQSSFV